VQVTYDPYSQTVRVQVVHGVGNPKEHYIGKVTVLINGREAIRQELARQDGPAGVTVSYRLPDAGPGDVITVEAYCNMGGDLRQNVTAPGNKPSS
jgi:desulfoferrodoxin (superoxide reductase-like protein)